MPRNIVTILDKNFSDLKQGERMYIASPEVISTYIAAIPKGTFKTQKEMRFELAKAAGADNTCPVTTGIFIRMAIESVLEAEAVEMTPLPFWRVVDEKHPVLKKLGIAASDIKQIRQSEGAEASF